MLKTFLNKIWLVIYFVVGALILEAITFRMLGLGIMPEYFFYNFVIILSIGFLVYLIPNYTAQYVVFTVILFIQAAFCYVNILLQFAYHDLFSIEMVRLIWAAGKAMTTSFVDFSGLLQLLCTFFVIAIAGAGIRRLCKREKIDKKQHFSIIVIVVLILVQSYSWAFYFNQRSKINDLANIKNSDYISSDTFLLNTEIMKTNSYKKFGTYGYLSNLIANYNKGIDHEVKKACIAYFDEGDIYGAKDNRSAVFAVDGVAKKNNLIIIMMESLEWFAFGDGTYDPSLNNLSDELTPNVYEVIYGEDKSKGTDDDSLVASNFFAKSKTNISEGFAILGNYPVGKLFRDITGKSYDDSLGAFDYSLPHILKDKGYVTSYVHSNEISYYHRSSTHNNLGFDNVIGKDKLRDSHGNKIYSGNDLNWNHWQSEAEFVDNAMEYLVPEGDKPFMTMYLNVSTHGPYDNNKYNEDYARYKNYVMYGPNNCEFDESQEKYILKSGVEATESNYSTWYRNVVNNENFSESFKTELLNWQCGVIGLDEGIGKILDELKVQGKYDSTDILLYSDHNAYYDNMSLKIKDLPESEVYGVENNTIPFVLSSPGLKSQYPGQYVLTDRFCSAYDIIPTLLDLMGISFNENLYLGNSLFKPMGDIYSLGGGTKINDMIVYYSNTGGLYSKNMYTFDMENFNYYKSDIPGTTSAERQELLNRFKSVATKTLIKVNYLNLLNKYYLYPYLTNK
ncbi:MAG: sulfatase-like hydrolase/transferase [Clostridia bacterium]|nr:sulfatase-like hydrolase/transferase [Clostridia bacterium]